MVTTVSYSMGTRVLFQGLSCTGVQLNLYSAPRLRMNIFAPIYAFMGSTAPQIYFTFNTYLLIYVE
jgi:hypothetical protein